MALNLRIASNIKGIAVEFPPPESMSRTQATTFVSAAAARRACAYVAVPIVPQESYLVIVPDIGDNSNAGVAASGGIRGNGAGIYIVKYDVEFSLGSLE